MIVFVNVFGLVAIILDEARHVQAYSKMEDGMGTFHVHTANQMT